jgi:hypothetical protein
VRTNLHSFSDQAARFATTRESLEHAAVNIARSIDDLGTRYARRAAAAIAAGDREAAYQLMLECFTQQTELAQKLPRRHLVVVS